MILLLSQIYPIKMSFNITTPNGLKIKLNNFLTYGGFTNSSIYSATTENDEEIAIKTVLYLEDRILIDECRKELLSIKKCKNLPFVMEHYEIFMTKEKLFIIMPKYKPIKHEPSIEQITKWFPQILIGLNAIHKQNIVHGDIKVNNLMLDENDNIRIIDFGISVEIGSTERDICAHIYKSKKRLENSIKTHKKASKKAKLNNDEEFFTIHKFPSAEPYDDLVAAAYTVLTMFNNGKIVKTMVDDKYFPRETFESILDEINSTDISEKISDIIKKKCSGNDKTYKFFHEFLTEILSFKSETTIDNIIDRMKENYSDILNIQELSESNYN